MRTSKLQGLWLCSAAFVFVSLAANAAPNPRSTADISVVWNAVDEAHITSSKDISNITVLLCDGTVRKLEGFGDGTPEYTLSGMGPIYAVSVKSGTTISDPSWNEHGCSEDDDEVPR